MCYVCAIKVSKEGKLVLYERQTLKRCKKHIDYNLWEVKVSDEILEPLKRLTFLDG